MTTDLTLALSDCLEAIDHNELTVEACVARYPDHRTSLSELLPVAALLRSAPAVTPSLDFRANARARLMARLPARRSRMQELLDVVRAPTFSRRPALVRVLISLLVVTILGASVAYASTGALPNDALYPIKLTVEQIRLAFTASARSQIELRLAFAAERLREIDRLVEAGREIEAVTALNEFDREIRALMVYAQASPDLAERVSVLTQVAAALNQYEQWLSASEAKLPTTAQAAIHQARSDIQAALQASAGDLPIQVPTNTPISSPLPTPTPRPTRSPQPPATHPVVIPTWPTDFPTYVPTWVTPDATYIATYRPTQWGTLNPTIIATIVPTRWRTLIPTAWPTILPTMWRTLIPTAFPTIHWPTLPVEPPVTWPTFPPPEKWPTVPPGKWPPGWP